MAGSDYAYEEVKPVEPLIGDATAVEAAETMYSASRTMLAAASALAAGLGPAGARSRELTAEAIEAGFLRALRRETLLGEAQGGGGGGAGSLLGLPGGAGIAGTGYGRMGASVTGHGSRSQLYGSIGGAIGYAIGGPVGALLGGMLGGLLGGDGDDERAAEMRQQEQLRRLWLNTPEGFEVQAYLYNLARNYRGYSIFDQLRDMRLPVFDSPSLRHSLNPIVVNLMPGSIQITGGGAEGGEQAARAFAGALGRVLRLNSVVVPAAAFGGEL